MNVLVCPWWMVSVADRKARCVPQVKLSCRGLRAQPEVLARRPGVRARVLHRDGDGEPLADGHRRRHTLADESCVAHRRVQEADEDVPTVNQEPLRERRRDLEALALRPGLGELRAMDEEAGLVRLREGDTAAQVRAAAQVVAPGAGQGLGPSDNVFRRERATNRVELRLDVAAEGVRTHAGIGETDQIGILAVEDLRVALGRVERVRHHMVEGVDVVHRQAGHLGEEVAPELGRPRVGAERAEQWAERVGLHRGRHEARGSRAGGALQLELAQHPRLRA